MKWYGKLIKNPKTRRSILMAVLIASGVAAPSALLMTGTADEIYQTLTEDE